MIRYSFKVIVSILPILFVIACSQTKSVELEAVPQTQSVEVPNDGSVPVAGFELIENPEKTITLSKIGDRVALNTGDKVNFIYEGLDYEETYLMYESTDFGYELTLMKLNDPVEIDFERMCQTYVVASPAATTVNVDDLLKYEQIIWTPRFDGTWEVRIGTVNRGCSSPALKHLNKLRSKEYNNKVKATKIKR